jgi:ABC-type multidrug transport system fused ATPase/permease subunit
MDYTYKNLYLYFAKYLRPHRSRLFLGSLLRFISALLELFNPIALAFVITFISKYKIGDSISPLYFVFIFWACNYFARNTLIYFSKMIVIVLGAKMAVDIEIDALEHISKIDIAWHEKENVGNKVKRIDKGSSGISTLIRVWVVNIIDIFVGIVAIFFIISHFDFILALLVSVFQVVQLVIVGTLKKRTLSAAKAKNIKVEESNGLIFEIMNNIRSIKVLGMMDPLLIFFQNLNVDLIRLIRVNLFWYHITMFLRTTWQSLSKLILYAYVIYGITEGRYELGFFVLFYAYVNSISTSITELSTVIQDVDQAKADALRLAELFNEKINIDSEAGKVDFPKKWDSIRVKNLSFAYGENKVLSDISFDIKKGEKVGLVGLSGAGKTTLFKLLLKEHESLENSIYIGDLPLNTITKTDYAKHVAAVLQDTEVFNLNLKTNIEIANNISTESIDKALEISHVGDFIQKLPHGVDTLIGEKGVKLSGGERQRLGIARAIYKNPEILFLDEATSHLDVESEGKIQDSLQHFFKDVTAVVIAHRLSTIKEMDKIIVLEHGKVLEVGTFSELYEKDGRFREFWDKQKI